MNSKNNMLKHFFVIGFGTLINLILGFFTTPIITRLVDPLMYGQFSIFTMYSNIALMVLCLGLDQAMVRFFYEKESEDYRRSLLFKCIKYPFWVSLIVSLVVIILNYFGCIKFEFKFNIVILLCVYTFIQVIYRFSLLILRLSYKTKLFSSLNVLYKLLYIIIVIPFLLFVFNDSLFALTFATTLTAGMCLIISLWSQSNLWDIRKNNLDQCHISMKEIIKYGYPYIFSLGITTLFQACDKIALNIFCTYKEVGIYASANTLIAVFAIVQGTFNSLWGPTSVEHYSADKEDRSFYQNGNRIITVLMFMMGTTLILFKDIFALLLGNKYREAAFILPFLIFNPIMYTISETTVCGIVFMKKSKIQVLVALGACITNVIGNFFLVPLLGGKGAAISTGISYIVFFSLRTFASNKFFYVDWGLRNIYLLTAITAIYAFINTFFEFGIWTIVGYLICFGVTVLLYRKTIVWIIDYCISLVIKKIKR